MTSVAVLLPVLDRPWRVEELVASLRGSQRDAELWPHFLVSKSDHAQQRAVRDARAYQTLCEWEPGAGDYARKINLGAALAVEDGFEWVFLGADDLCFCPGWADEAIREGDRHGADVVGTNDLGNPVVRAGLHATHSLIRASYVAVGTIDEPGKLLHEGYDHQFSDTELVGTARYRGVWAFARDSMVEHLHHLWPDGRGGRKSQMDATYEKGQRASQADYALYRSRAPMWGG